MLHSNSEGGGVWILALPFLFWACFWPCYRPFKRIMKSRYREEWMKLVFWDIIHIEYVNLWPVLRFILRTEDFGDPELRRAKRLARIGLLTAWMLLIAAFAWWIVQESRS